MNKLFITRFGLALLLSCITSAAGVRADGIDPGALQALAENGNYVFTHYRENAATDGIRREVVSFVVDDLHQYALVLWPAGEAPETGWPVLQFNHGYHPDPPRNGFNAAGESDRPGDYYRETVQGFARAGFVVVVPDFRGHNVSEGGDYTGRILADAWYSRDAIACFLALASLPGVDLERAYMLGHSMGGLITIRAMLALGDQVRAGSVWSTAGGGLAALLMRELAAAGGEDSDKRPKSALDLLAREVAALGEGVDPERISPLRDAALLRSPLSIQHALEDRSTPAAASLELAARLYLAGKRYQLQVYPGDNHLFAGADLAAAVARDLSWFRRFR